MDRALESEPFFSGIVRYLVRWACLEPENSCFCCSVELMIFEQSTTPICNLSAFLQSQEVVIVSCVLL